MVWSDRTDTPFRTTTIDHCYGVFVGGGAGGSRRLVVRTHAEAHECRPLAVYSTVRNDMKVSVRSYAPPAPFCHLEEPRMLLPSGGIDSRAMFVECPRPHVSASDSLTRMHFPMSDRAGLDFYESPIPPKITTTTSQETTTSQQTVAEEEAAQEADRDFVFRTPNSRKRKSLHTTVINTSETNTFEDGDLPSSSIWVHNRSDHRAHIVAISLSIPLSEH